MSQANLQKETPANQASENLSALVFIILRHVSSAAANVLWSRAYVSIRGLYPDVPIMIIDDASPVLPSATAEGKVLVNCVVISSEFPKRGELLPYYYFHKLKPAQKAVIVHDSVFINKPLELEPDAPYKFLWHFETHQWDDDVLINAMLKMFEKHSKALSEVYWNKKGWHGCFGGMSIITWEFLHQIDTGCGFFATLLPLVQSRRARMCFERLFACVCVSFGGRIPSAFGDIYRWNSAAKVPWGFTWPQYLLDKPRCDSLPSMKVWSGR